jgi:hypothetical protein
MFNGMLSSNMYHSPSSSRAQTFDISNLDLARFAAAAAGALELINLAALNEINKENKKKSNAAAELY